MALCQGLTTVVALQVIFNIKVQSVGQGPQILLNDFCAFLVTKVYKYFYYSPGREKVLGFSRVFSLPAIFGILQNSIPK